MSVKNHTILVFPNNLIVCLKSVRLPGGQHENYTDCITQKSDRRLSKAIMPSYFFFLNISSNYQLNDQ